MVASGSAPRRLTIHPLLALVAFVAGVTAMVKGIGLVSVHGMHAALITGEAMLALPGLLLVALSRASLVEGLGLRRVSTRAALLAALAGAALWGASLGLMNVQFVV